MFVKGHSGFGIELVDELTIRKSATGVGAQRLQRQIEKQIFFYKNFQQEKVRTPKILKRVESPEAFHADMEFIAAKDFIQFLSEADRKALDDFLNTIVGWIRHNLKLCETVEVSEKIKSKLAELQKKKVPAKYILAAKKMCAGDVCVPVGPCHGDLTLSNILFKTDALYLLDFLDCYVESPLQDVAKLRQDTCFGWSLQLYQADFNPAKIQIAFRYLDRRLEVEFLRDEWYGRHYKLFQLMNLMRVLPYCMEHKTIALITGSLDQVLRKIPEQSR